jgi:hypothetical protein
MLPCETNTREGHLNGVAVRTQYGLISAKLAGFTREYSQVSDVTPSVIGGIIGFSDLSV